MIGKILASGQLGKLASFVSPAFFDVMPAKALWSRGRALMAGTRNHEAFRHAVASRSAELEARLPQVDLVAERKAVKRSSAPLPSSPEWRGGSVVELYFHQLFYGEFALLDLRSSAFTDAGERLVWHPAAWFTEWSPEFISALRDIYRGFYSQDDAMFQRGLAALSLQHSSDLFLKHFGSGVVTFRTVDFVNTFHQVFQRCKEVGVALHPDFLPLGIYLAALYDHLEDLAVAVDVGAAFERATRASTTHPEAVHA